MATGTKHQPTPAQLEALRRGRAIRDANRENGLKPTASASRPSPTPRSATARPSASSAGTLTSGARGSWVEELGLPEGNDLATPPAAPQPSRLPVSDAPDGESADEPDEDELPPAATQRGSDPEPDAASLQAIFESVAGTEGDPHTQPTRTRRMARKHGRSSPKTTAASGGKANGDAPKAKTTPAAKRVEQKEAEVEAAAEQWYETAAALFILGMAWLIGQDLKPDEEQAAAVTEPLIRIFMRHYDPARKASADASDIAAAGMAFALYMQAIWPALQERRRERRFARAQRQQFNQPRQPVRPISPAASYGPAPAASGPGGLPQDADGVGSRGAGPGPEQSARSGLDAESVLAEIGLDALGEVA